MLIAINILLCLTNVLISFREHKKGNYFTSMFNAFVAGFCAAVAIAIALNANI